MIEDGTKLEEGVKRNPRCGNNRNRTSLWGDHPVWNVERSVMRLTD